jgi:rSAM/selenodomain-associated transferase 1
VTSLIVIAKAPRAGAAKTRLCPPLQPAQAAGLAAAFLLDTLETVQRAGLAARAICRDARERAALARLLRDAAAITVQRGRGLGAALDSAFRAGFDAGFAAVGVLGADIPTLPAAVVRQAFTTVANGADVALGPSEDGGYYLLVARRRHPELFRNMTWSTASVARVTLERCRELGLRTAMLPRWYDVDDAAALDRLEAELAASPSDVAPHTRTALAGRRVEEPRPRRTRKRRSGRYDGRAPLTGQGW